jgi:hypothetical protein
MLTPLVSDTHFAIFEIFGLSPPTASAFSGVQSALDYKRGNTLSRVDHKADFILLGRYSGGFSIHFVEVEPPNVPLYTKKGVPHARLAGAINLKARMAGIETAQATQHQTNPIAPRWTFRVRTH